MFLCEVTHATHMVFKPKYVCRFFSLLLSCPSHLLLLLCVYMCVCVCILYIDICSPNITQVSIIFVDYLC